jgi:hypothetical protein
VPRTRPADSRDTDPRARESVPSSERYEPAKRPAEDPRVTPDETREDVRDAAHSGR